MLEAIHRYIDRAGRPTYVYERAVGIALELALLVAVGLDAITGPRSAVVVVLVSAARLLEFEFRRQERSVQGRHRERGGVSPLPAEKATAARARDKNLVILESAWPALALLLPAADKGQFTLALLVAVVVTLVRVAWSRWAMPAWRRSRLAWRLEHAARSAVPGVRYEFKIAGADELTQAFRVSEQALEHSAQKARNAANDSGRPRSTDGE